MTTSLVPVGDAQLHVSDFGSGEPVVLVQTALTADELLPLARESALADFRKLVYHRRGYGRSSPARSPGSVTADAADCTALLTALGIDQAHIVGFSYSGAVAMQLASLEPRRVTSLTLIEPPPVHTASAPEFRAANDELVRDRWDRGPAVALDAFLSRVIGPTWRTTIEDTVPGAAEQMARDASTFFDSDMLALLSWEFGPDDARRIICPVLHVAGSDSAPWFAQVRELVLGWLPRAEDVVVAGADHDLPLTHTAAVATAVASFLRSQR